MPVFYHDVTAGLYGGLGGWYNLLPPSRPGDDYGDDDDGGGEDSTPDRCAATTTKKTTTTTTASVRDPWIDAFYDCPPPPRVGHISAVRGDYLYVSGGLLYDRSMGVFRHEDVPYVYRLRIRGTLTSLRPSSRRRRATTTGEGEEGDDGGDELRRRRRWERIVPRARFSAPAHGVNGHDDKDNDRTRYNTGTPHTYGGLDEYTDPFYVNGSLSPEEAINRWEIRGGLWESKGVGGRGERSWCTAV